MIKLIIKCCVIMIDLNFSTRCNYNKIFYNYKRRRIRN